MVQASLGTHPSLVHWGLFRAGNGTCRRSPLQEGSGFRYLGLLRSQQVSSVPLVVMASEPPRLCSSSNGSQPYDPPIGGTQASALMRAAHCLSRKVSANRPHCGEQ